MSKNKNIISKFLSLEASEVFLTIYCWIRSWTPTIEVLSLIPYNVPPSKVDLIPRMVNPNPINFTYKSSTCHGVPIGFGDSKLCPYATYLCLEVYNLSMFFIGYWRLAIVEKEG